MRKVVIKEPNALESALWTYGWKKLNLRNCSGYNVLDLYRAVDFSEFGLKYISTDKELCHIFEVLNEKKYVEFVLRYS